MRLRVHEPYGQAVIVCFYDFEMNSVNVQKVVPRAVKKAVLDNGFAAAHTDLEKIGGGRHFPRRAFLGRELDAVNGQVPGVLHNECEGVIEPLLYIFELCIFALADKYSRKLTADIVDIISVARLESRGVRVADAYFPVSEVGYL